MRSSGTSNDPPHFCLASYYVACTAAIEQALLGYNIYNVGVTCTHVSEVGMRFLPILFSTSSVGRVLGGKLKGKSGPAMYFNDIGGITSSATPRKLWWTHIHLPEIMSCHWLGSYVNQPRYLHTLLAKTITKAWQRCVRRLGFGKRPTTCRQGPPAPPSSHAVTFVASLSGARG